VALPPAPPAPPSGPDPALLAPPLVWVVPPASLADPIRTRVLHHWATTIGVPRASLSHRHVAVIDALVTNWHGQGATQLPGGFSVHRSGHFLSYSRS
jgi:hypothetical protein